MSESSRWRRARSLSDITALSFSKCSEAVRRRAPRSWISLSRREKSFSILAWAALAGAESRMMRSVLTKPMRGLVWAMAGPATEARPTVSAQASAAR